MSFVPEFTSRSRPARYINIAVDIATRIARGEYQEGQRIFGRSSLAGRYNVSPETIRRALALLEERGIVKLHPGVGVTVNSRVAAENYVAEFGQRQVLSDIQKQLHSYLEERNKLDQEIARLTSELLNYTFKMATRLQRIQEFRVEQTSPFTGKSLGEVQFRSQTGATVLAIQRNGREIISPEAQTVIQPGDILIVIAHPETFERCQEFGLTPLTGLS
ncbi:MAG: Transcriptional regulator GntR family [Thermoanaerobacterales bacterium 50_218]|nr:MAG: Transcriptional regulator GntR family [Thermoanaerobacterales bacterium 50_218]HAA89006.1 GntR family transcriptional regulator [Peptococcaceae bacterium]